MPLQRSGAGSSVPCIQTQAVPRNLGGRAGWGNRHVYENDGKEISPPQTASDVKTLLADAMAEIRAGKMDPKLGTTLGYLGTSLLKAIETSDIEQRLERLEATNELKDAH